jgi:hypothetical protein
MSLFTNTAVPPPVPAQQKRDGRSVFSDLPYLSSLQSSDVSKPAPVSSGYAQTRTKRNVASGNPFSSARRAAASRPNEGVIDIETHSRLLQEKVDYFVQTLTKTMQAQLTRSLRKIEREETLKLLQVRRGCRGLY